MRHSFLVLAGCLFVSTGPVQAWNSFGHMETAAVAWQQLTPAAKKEATRLLKKNPRYKTWIKGIAADHCRETSPKAGEALLSSHLPFPRNG